jgi:hypothetical protein
MNNINFETSINAPKERVWKTLADFYGIQAFLEKAPQLLNSSLIGLIRYTETGQQIEISDLHSAMETTSN